jgi:hypothetical protein
MLKTRLLKFILILAIVLLLTLFQNVTLAQSTSQLSSRISRLESENSLLRSRIGRLESQLSNIGRASDIEIPDVPSQSTAGGSTLSSDPMFNNLATLVIELRDRIIDLENRVSELAPPR